MTSKWIWLLSRLARRIWFRAALLSALAIVTALLAIIASPYIPAGLSTKIGADSVDKILGIIASSMLTVTTFSLSTMVSAYSAATSNVTPRATRLVMEDSTTQNVLATFVGSFLFSLVGIIALAAGAYGDQGRLILFGVTIGIVILIVVTLLRWIDHLSRLGRVTETTERVEQATIAAIRNMREMPFLGGRPFKAGSWNAEKPNHPVMIAKVGYVQHVDMAAMSAIAEQAGVEIALVAIPGKLISPVDPIAWVNATISDDVQTLIRQCFSIEDTRSFDQDPRFGASVLAEIASRALSPAVNDPGTAIDVISRAMRVLAVWSEKKERSAEIQYPRLHVAPIALADLFDDLFTPIARDGAGLVEVGIRLQKAFISISRFDDAEFHVNALRHSSDALARAEFALHIDSDKEKLRRLTFEIRAAQ